MDLIKLQTNILEGRWDKNYYIVKENKCYLALNGGQFLLITDIDSILLDLKKMLLPFI